MRSTRIGATDVRVTALGFGGAAIGNLFTTVDDHAACAAVDAAWARGVRFFDTAPHYGLGLSERRLGKALAARSRDEYAISTKVGRLLVPNPCPTGSDLPGGGFAVADDLTRRWDFSARGVRASIESSLERLGLARIDIALVHDPDHALDQAIGESLPALERLRDEGIVGAIGVGMVDARALEQVVERTEVDVVMLAGRFTLVDRSGERLLDRCLERGVSVLAAAPFSSGLLAARWPVDGARHAYRPASPAVLERARELARTCDRHGVPLPAAALQFALRHPAVASVVVGMRSVSEVIEDAAWMGAAIPEELWAELRDT